MKVRNKITFVFVLLTSFLQIVIFMFIYYFSEEYTIREFYLRLSQRATIAAQAYLEENKSNIDIYNDVRTLHLERLPGECEEIYKVDVKNQTVQQNKNKILPDSFFQEIFKNRYAEINIEDYYYTGILFNNDEESFIAVLSAQDMYGEAKQKNLRNILIIAFLLNLVATSLLGKYYAKQALGAITKIINRVNSIEATNLHLRLDPGKNNDELSKLAHTFNKMLDRLETSFEVQSNFINNASHELRNPLTAILGQTEVALNKDRSTGEYVSILKEIENEALRLDILVNGLLKLARTDYNKKGLVIQPIRLDQLIIDIKNSIDKTNPENKIVLDFDDMPTNEDLLVIEGNNGLLAISLNNILDNACKFSQNQKVALKLLANEEIVKIIVTDVGIGIPSDELGNIFEPFYRGSNARGLKGFGFGLPLAYKIIKLHGGEISVSSQIEKGTIVKLIFPVKNNISKTKNKF